MKIKLDSDYATQRAAADRGLDKLPPNKLKPIADEKGVVTSTELDRLANVAGVDLDGKLSPAEKKRIDAYLTDRAHPIIADSGAQKALSIRARKPVDAYLALDHKSVGSDVLFTYDVGVYKSADSSTRDEHSKQILVKGLSPRSSDYSTGISLHRYGTTGADSSVGYQSQGSGAGFIAGVADKNKGVVLLNLPAAGAVAGDAPDVRTLFTPAALARSPAVKELAKKLGIDPKKVSVDVTGVSFHSDFQKTGGKPHNTLHTLLVDVELKEVGSKKKPKEAQLSALVHGNPTKALSKLEIDGLEAGVQTRWGFVYPPSVKFDDDKPTKTSDSGSTRRGGGGESGGIRSHRGGGGEGGGLVRRRGGGGEGGGNWVNFGGGGE